LLIFRNMVSWQSFFQQSPDSSSKSSNNHQTCKSRWNNISITSKYEIYQWIIVNYDINSEAKWTYQAASLQTSKPLAAPPSGSTPLAPNYDSGVSTSSTITKRSNWRVPLYFSQIWNSWWECSSCSYTWFKFIHTNLAFCLEPQGILAWRMSTSYETDTISLQFTFICTACEATHLSKP
jgi:hypothetical protein